MRVLVIDDNKADAELLQNYIRKSFPTATITVCNNFLGGAKKLYRNRHDAIFLDLNLPDNWGISTVRDIKKYAKSAPIFVTTGVANHVTIEEALKAGAAEVREKKDLSTATVSRLVGNQSFVG